MSALHTPGPWECLPEEVDKPYIRIRGTRLGGRYRIANVDAPIYKGMQEREADAMANARLIAAAPDLLEALQGVLPFMEAAEDAGLVGDEGCYWPVEVARAAIAKATGGQP